MFKKWVENPTKICYHNGGISFAFGVFLMRKILGYIFKILLLYIISTAVVGVLGLIFQKTLPEILVEGFVNTLCFIIVIWLIKKINKKQKNNNDD